MSADMLPVKGAGPATTLVPPQQAPSQPLYDAQLKPPKKQRVARGAVIAIACILGILVLAACVTSIVTCVLAVQRHAKTAEVPLVEVVDGVHVRLVPQGRVPASALPTPITRVAICAFPIIDMLYQVVCAEEARHLRALADSRATALLPVNSRRCCLRASTVRGESPIIASVERRLAAIAGVPTEYMEPLELLVFRENHFFAPHVDWHEPGKALERQHGQRTVTIIVHLNSLLAGDGGETAVPYTGHSIVPELGKAILLHNVTETGHPDARVAHASLPVAAPGKVKYILLARFRDKPVTYVPVTTLHSTAPIAKYKHFTYDNDGDLLAPM